MLGRFLEGCKAASPGSGSRGVAWRMLVATVQAQCDTKVQVTWVCYLRGVRSQSRQPQGSEIGNPIRVPSLIDGNSWGEASLAVRRWIYLFIVQLL
jgi:hypothetical protein